MRLRAPMPRLGPVKARWLAHQGRSRRAVMARCLKNGALHCEGCDRPGPLDYSHVVGRRNIVGEPFASSPELTQGLCRECHRRYDSYAVSALRRKLEEAAILRLATRYHKPLLVDALRHPMDAIRRMVAELEKEGAGAE